MEPGETHYGERIISILKKRSEYGSYFSYEEYQLLKQAETAEQFAEFLRGTKWREVVVFAEPSVTLADLRDMQPIVERKSATLLAAIDTTAGCSFPLGCFLGLFVFFIGVFFKGFTEGWLRWAVNPVRAERRKKHTVVSDPQV